MSDFIIGCMDLVEKEFKGLDHEQLFEIVYGALASIQKKINPMKLSEADLFDCLVDEILVTQEIY